MPTCLRIDDPEPRYAAVRLRADAPFPQREFARDDGGWVLHLPPTGLARFEYKLELVERDGTARVVCDPGNPARVSGPFGEKSVMCAPGYQPPAWLSEPQVRGSTEVIRVRVLGRALEVGVWSPGEGRMPLLVAHDGPEYDSLSALTRYAGATIERRALPPFRVALLPPGDRDEWYSASAAYGRALCSLIVPALRAAVAVDGPLVGMGASLGALAMLHALRRWPGTFGGLFLQSGSYFSTRRDRGESGFPRYGRIVRFVRSVLRAESHSDPLPVAMTCGTEEENIANNRLMVAALTRQGYAASLHEVPDLHNYTAWRDAFDPYLTGLLARSWSPRWTE